MLFSIALLLGASGVVRGALQDCFTPNGTSRNTMVNATVYLPCDSTAEHSMCCRLVGGSGADQCKPGGICFNPTGNLYWRESCTDPTWKSPACQKLFVNGTGFPGTGAQITQDGDPVTDVQITLCENGSYCYGPGNLACCQQNKGVWIKNGTQTNVNPNASPSASSSTSASATSSNPAQTSGGSTSADSSSGLSTGAKAGIGVGVSLGALAIIGLAAFLILRRRKAATPYKEDHVIHEAGGETRPSEKYEMQGNVPPHAPAQENFYEVEGSHVPQVSTHAQHPK